MSQSSSSLETYSPNTAGSIAPEGGISKSALIIAAIVAVAVAFLYFRNRK